MKPIFAVFVTSATVVACAVHHETTPASVELDASVARSQASALTAAVTAAQGSDGAAIADAMGRVGDLAAGLVPETRGGMRRRGASTTCSCPSGSTTCTFSACTIGDATVTGSVSWADGAITCTNLALDAPAAHVEVDCALTYATGTIAGTVHTTGSATVSGTTYGWDANLTAKAITFTSSALTGGSLDVSATVTSGADATSYTASAVVTLP